MFVDEAGNIVIAGAYGSGSPDFGNGPLPGAVASTSSGSSGSSSSSTSSSGGTFPPEATYGFVVKFSPTGAALWSQGSVSGSSQGHVMAIDGSGNVLVTDVDGTGFYVQKLSPSGAQVWKKSWPEAAAPANCHGSSTHPYPRYTVSADQAGNVVVAGSLIHECGGSPIVNSFGGAALPAGGTTAIAKLDPNGNVLWSNALGASDGLPSGVEAISLDATGDIFYRENGGDAAGNPVSKLRKLDPDGVLAWSKAMPAGVVFDVAPPVVFAPGGQLVYVSDPVTPSLVADISMLDAQGDVLWTKSFSDTGSCASYAHVARVYTAAVDGAGNVFAAGYIAGVPYCSIDLGNGPITKGAIWVAKLDKSGNTLWSMMYGSGLDAINPWPVPLGATPGGDLVMTGTFTTATLDLATGLTPLSSGGATSFFLADVGP